jgi:hypothetical protein
MKKKNTQAFVTGMEHEKLVFSSFIDIMYFSLLILDTLR